jgi:hypothetical protein
MKRLKLEILGFGVACLVLCGCSDDYLDVTSKTQSDTGNYYTTETDAYRALIGCYDGWQRTSSDLGSFSFYLASEVMADECFGGAGNTDGYGYQAVDRFDITQSSSDLNLMESMWKTYYAAVNRCNELIHYDGIGQISWKSRQGTYMGECHALRALLYFDMVRLWGNIPLKTEPSNDNPAQADPDAVYALIAGDLKYAIDSIPAGAYPKSDAASNDGHITKYAAEALMARVFLFYTGYYGKTELKIDDNTSITKADALAYVEDVISSKQYDLVAEYKNLWPAASDSWSGDDTKGWTETSTYAGDGNVETILAQKFNDTQNYNGDLDGNRWQVMIGMRNSMNVVPYGNGWGGCSVNPKIKNAFGTGDQRLTASIVDLDGEGVSSATGFDGLIADTREYTGYMIKKYIPRSIHYYNTSTGKWTVVNEASVGHGNNDFQISNYQDFIVMRYSDVLLMAAELGSPSAKTYLNEVRRRAYTKNGALDSHFKTVEATQENIMNERMLEFAFEGQRYWDLLRQGVSAAADAIADDGTTVLSGGTSATVTINKQNVIDKKGLCQIPYNQITLSGNVLKQNAGW